MLLDIKTFHNDDERVKALGEYISYKHNTLNCGAKMNRIEGRNRQLNGGWRLYYAPFNTRTRQNITNDIEDLRSTIT